MQLCAFLVSARWAQIFVILAPESARHLPLHSPAESAHCQHSTVYPNSWSNGDPEPGNVVLPLWGLQKCTMFFHTQSTQHVGPLLPTPPRCTPSSPHVVSPPMTTAVHSAVRSIGCRCTGSSISLPECISLHVVLGTMLVSRSAQSHARDTSMCACQQG